MMSNPVLQMQDAGFTREQVEALTAYVDSGAATKADIERVEGRLTLVHWMLGVSIAVGITNGYMIIKMSQVVATLS